MFGLCRFIVGDYYFLFWWHLLIINSNICDRFTIKHFFPISSQYFGGSNIGHLKPLLYSPAVMPPLLRCQLKLPGSLLSSPVIGAKQTLTNAKSSRFVVNLLDKEILSFHNLQNFRQIFSSEAATDNEK